MAQAIDFNDKNVIGNAAWKVLHAFANQYPETPTAEDRKEFHTLIKGVLRTIPDDTGCKCRSNAVEYIQKNNPPLNSRKELVKWVCDFHNDVNRRTGKQEFDCKLLLAPPVCKTCNTKPQVAADKDGPLKTIMGEYKQLSIRVFEELCKKENLEMPKIVFAPCPTIPSTSCSTFLVDKDTKDVLTKETPIVYINPSNFGLRVLVHEANHYIKKMKKKHGESINEELIEKHTQEIIKKYFPADSYDKENKKLVAPLVMGDRLVEPLHNPTLNTKRFNVRRYMSSIGETFPTYARIQQRYQNPNQPQDGEGGLAEASKEPSGGLLSYFDGLYEPVAKHLNISARELNLANTPNIFSEGTKMLLNSQLSSFGSLISTTLLGIAMFVATALNKEGIGHEDRRLLAQLGGQFLWSGIQEANNVEVHETAMQVGSYLSSMEFDKITPLLFNVNSFVSQAQQQQEKGIIARSRQRGHISSVAGGGTGLGSAGGGGAGPLDGGFGLAKGKAVDVDEMPGAGVGVGPAGVPSNVIHPINPATLRRIQERAEGVETAPESIRTFRNFPAGTAAPRATSSGGIGFTYVPQASPIGLSTLEREFLQQQGYAVDDLQYE